MDLTPIAVIIILYGLFIGLTKIIVLINDKMKL
jgi:hypothetical protein